MEYRTACKCQVYNAKIRLNNLYSLCGGSFSMVFHWAGDMQICQMTSYPSGTQIKNELYWRDKWKRSLANFRIFFFRQYLDWWLNSWYLWDPPTWYYCFPIEQITAAPCWQQTQSSSSLASGFGWVALVPDRLPSLETHTLLLANGRVLSLTSLMVRMVLTLSLLKALLKVYAFAR